MYLETYVRTLMKTVSWRFWATLITAALVVIFTGETKIALAIGGIEVFTKMGAYFVHERVWNRINLGKVKVKSGVVWLNSTSNDLHETASGLEAHLKSKGIKAIYMSFESLKKSLIENGVTANIDKVYVAQAGYFISALEQQGVTVIVTSLDIERKYQEAVKAHCSNNIEILLKGESENLDRSVEQHLKGIEPLTSNSQGKAFEIDTNNLSSEDRVKKVAKYYFSNIRLKAV